MAVAVMALAPASPVRAESLVSTLSDENIEITSDFTGGRIVVFGTIRGVPPELRDDPGYRVAVVVHGPEEEVIARRKDRILGLWINAASHEFFKVPAYYVVHMSDGFLSETTPDQIARYKLAFDQLNFVRSSYESDTRAFADALIDIRRSQGLFVSSPEAIRFLAPNVFRTTFSLPALVPVGVYRVSVFVFRDEKLLATETENLLITKKGISDRIATFARQQGLIYGILTVLLGIFTGWAAGLVFRRD